jgi:general secretion pathway protein G
VSDSSIVKIDYDYDYDYELTSTNIKKRGYKIMKNQLRISRARRGFTLVEIMVVVVVLGILAAVIIPNLFGQTDKAMVSRARSDIATLATEVNAFRLDMHRVPTQDEGLGVLRVPPQGDDANLWKGPYATKDIPPDPWGVPYQYYAPCPNGVDEFGISSFGRDKAAGGTGLDQDINSWEDYDAVAAGGDASGGAAPAAPAGQ